MIENSSTFECHEAVEDVFYGRCETRPIVSVAALANGLGLSRIGVNHIGQLAKPHPGLHRHGDLADHIAGMAADNRRTQDLVRAFLNLNFYKTFSFAVDNTPVDIGKLPRKSGKRNVAFLQLIQER